MYKPNGFKNGPMAWDTIGITLTSVGHLTSIGYMLTRVS
jgi:hypothetical protein